MIAKIKINETTYYYNLDKLVSATFIPAHHRKADPPDFPEAKDMPATLELMFDCPDIYKGFEQENGEGGQEVFLYTIRLQGDAALEVRNILDYGAVVAKADRS